MTLSARAIATQGFGAGALLLVALQGLVGVPQPADPPVSPPVYGGGRAHERDERRTIEAVEEKWAAIALADARDAARLAAEVRDRPPTQAPAPVPAVVETATAKVVHVVEQVDAAPAPVAPELSAEESALLMLIMERMAGQTVTVTTAPVVVAAPAPASDVLALLVAEELSGVPSTTT